MKMVELTVDEFIFKATDPMVIMDTAELVNKINRKCHKIILTRKLLKHFIGLLDKMQERARDQFTQALIKTYKGIFFNKMKREVIEGIQVEEMKDFKDDIDREVIAAALHSNDKILITTDEKLINKVKEKSLTKNYGLKPYILREALNVL